MLKKESRAAFKFTYALLALVVCVSALGCGGKTMTEEEVMAQLNASGLTIEKLPEATITSQQRDRLGVEPETLFSIRVTDGNGSSQSMTLVQFSKDWQASAVGDRGVNGFAIHNWFFVGTISQNIRSQIQAAFL